MVHTIRLLVVTFALWAASAPAQDTNDFADAVRSQLASGSHSLLRNPNFARDRAALDTLYERQGYASVWLNSAGQLTPQAQRLLQTLRTAESFGLRSPDYDGTALTYAAVELGSARTLSAQSARFDLGLSIATARLLRHLHFGRIDPRLAGFALDAPRAPFDLASAVERVASADDIDSAIAEVEPQFLHYRLLKLAIRQYRLLALEPDLSRLPAFKARSIKTGDEYAGIANLRTLLIAVGDLAPDAKVSDMVFDTTLSAAVMRFQRRHGLEADGTLGRKTFAALTTPLSVRADQLSMTLERWRWLPELDAPPIIVNIPQFKLFAFRSTEDRADAIQQMDVIVGQTVPTTQTPIFMADMKYLVFRPYWDVPESILQEEMLPEMRKNPDYFGKNNLEGVSSADPNAPALPESADLIPQLEQGTVRLRQKPGPENALGLVKLMFPNPYNVYLHSTPTQRLFNEPRRAFSHGCIRVSDPVGLVEHVLRAEPGDWTRERIEAAMNDETPGGQNRHVFLNKRLPVLIVYGTAMALENGEVQFFEDLYGHDAKLAQLLR